MKIVIIAFDGLDYPYVNEYQKWNLLQKSYGTSNLNGYIKGGGNPDYLTDEIFATFLTGTVPDVHGVKIPIDLEFTLKDKIPTIFDFKDNSCALDVPSYNRHPKQHKFQERVGWFLGHSAHRKAIDMDEDDYWKKVIKQRTTLREDIYEYLYKDKWYRVIEALEEDADITMIYFWFTDILGHTIPNGKHHENMYTIADNIVKDIKTIRGSERLYMVMSDHGMYRGQHRPEGAFWSLSEPLLSPSTIPQMEDWYNIIKGWIERV